MFDYDWFHGQAFEQQLDEAKWRCASIHFPEQSREEITSDEETVAFMDELELRTLIYLRDGFSYELKSFAQVCSKSHLTFECEPVDEHYRVGSFRGHGSIRGNRPGGGLRGSPVGEAGRLAADHGIPRGR